MSEALSQDEINALLNGGDSDENEVENDTASEVNSGDFLSDLEKDALGEVANISMGSAATALYGLLGQKVSITTPRVEFGRVKEFIDSYTRPCIVVDVQYIEGLKGSNQLVLEQKDAAIITDLMMGGDGKSPPEDLGELHISAVGEAMNQMMGSASTSMSDFFEGNKINISPPKAELLDINSESFKVDGVNDDGDIVKITFDMNIGDLIDSQIVQVMTVEFAKKMAEGIMGGVAEEEVKEEEPMQQPTQQGQPMQQGQGRQQGQMQGQPMQQGQGRQQGQMQGQPMQQGQGRQQGQMQGQPMQQGQGTQQGQMQGQPMQQRQGTQQGQMQGQNVEVQQVEFNQLGASPASGFNNDIRLIYDVPLELTVRLGKTRVSIRDILELSPGSVIELDRLAGEAVDLLVNGKLIAKGEVVVIDENFGFRVTDIVSSEERLKNI